MKAKGYDPSDRAIHAAEYQRQHPPKDTTQYNSSHYDEPNILAHARYNTRNIDGDKTLFIEEIQSDWHQAGRNQGYKTGVEHEDKQYLLEKRNGLMAQRRELEAQGDIAGGNALGGEINMLQGRLYEVMESGAVPDAPYKATDKWQGLAFRRTVKEAVDQGHDRIAWTKGKTQIDRYEETLRRNVDEVTYEPVGDGTYNVAAEKGGSVVHDVDGVTLDEIQDLYGKDIAGKIEKDTGGFGERPLRPDLKVLTGDDLSIGGEGMKSFYDKMMVNTANTFGKKYGAKVEVKPMWTAEAYDKKALDEFTAGGGDMRAAEAEGIRTGEAQEVWSMKITPEMKKAMAGGVALSGAGVAVMPEFPDYFTAPQEGQKQ